jgi:aerotaxis receptor
MTRLRTDAASLGASTDLSRRTLIDTVRTSVADAKRRMHLRLPVQQPCELIVSGVSHVGHLLNISEGGARVVCEGKCAVESRGELRVAAFQLATPCNVVAGSVEEGEISLAFAVPIVLPPPLRGLRVRAA